MKLRHREKRRGAAVVGFALVAPVFIMLVFGMLEFGRGVMVQQVLVNASREGARTAVLEGAILGEIEDRMDVYLNSANINTKTIIYTINGTEVADPTTVANFGDAKGVEMRVNFDDVDWVPIPQYIGGKILRVTSFVRRETSQPL